MRRKKWRRDEPAGPRSVSAQIAREPRGEPEIVVVAEILGHRTGDRLAGKGGDRARHRDGAGANRRRRARYRPVARADGSGIDRRAAPTRASRQAASPSSNRAAHCVMPAPRFAGSFFSRRRNGWALISTRSTSRTARFPGPAMSEPAIGNLPGKSRSIATPRRTRGRRRQRDARSPETRSSGSTYPTRCLPDRDSSTIRRCRECCTAACCGRRMRARNSGS